MRNRKVAQTDPNREPARERLVGVHERPRLLPHHEHELFIESGIDPTVAARRGCYSASSTDAAAAGFAPSQCHDGLMTPLWTLAGVQRNFLLKPTEPRVDESGKKLKYEQALGSIPHCDIHPDAQPLLRDPSVTLYFTEGTKKADALWSRGVPCVALTGVYHFLYDKLVVPDLDDIDLDGRRVRVTFDSDMTRKASVADALLRLCAALHRRGAIVDVVYLPEGPNGEKVGVDDWLVTGHTTDELDALAKRWDGKGPGVWLRDSHTATNDCDAWRQRAVAAETALSEFIQAVHNPEVTLALLRAMTAVGALAMAKQARGDVDAAGKPVISSAEIADDWRPKPPPKERLPERNPTGTRPRMARKNVRPIMLDAIHKGIIHAEPIPVDRRHAGGAAWRDTAWAIAPITDWTQILNPLATLGATQPKRRKPRTLATPCVVCGEVHPIHRRDYCGGCGALVSKTIIAPDTSGPVRETGDTLSPVQTPTPSPTPSRNGTYVMSGLPQEPDWLRDAPDVAVVDAAPAIAAQRLHDRESSDDFGLVAPVLHEPQQVLDFASRAAPDDTKRALNDLQANLSRIAAARGRTPIPKPQAAPLLDSAELAVDPWDAPYIEPAGEAGWDQWTQ